MLAYLQNQLTVEEKQQFEKLLRDDPFAQEALEGLQSSKNVAAVTRSIESVKKNVRAATGVAETKAIQIHWANYAWAAAVFGLLIGIGFLMVNYLSDKGSGIAQTQEKTLDTETNLLQGKEEGQNFESAALAEDTTKEEIVFLSDSLSLKSSEPTKGGTSEKDNAVFLVKKPEASTDVKTTTAQTGAKEGNEKTTNIPSVAPSVINNNQAAMTNESAAAGAVKEQAQTKAEELVTDAQTERAELVTKGAGAEKKTSKRDKEKSSGTAVTMDDMNASRGKEPTVNDAMKSFNAGDYQTSGEQFNAILKKDPNNPDALYYGGICDYINNTNSKGEKNFDKLLKSGNRYIEGSKWYKANILIQKGKKEEARKLLNDLANTNSSYKERAIKKLAEMEF